MIKKLFTAYLFNIIIANCLFSQIGGNSVYYFLELPNHAKIASLGGKNITIKNNINDFALQNPSLLNNNHDKNISLNYINYFSDINWGTVSYSFTTSQKHSFLFGIQYLNYGDFIAADQYGTITGKFTAADYLLNAIWSYPIDSVWTVGLNFKPIYSQLERYKSYGFGIDFGLNYYIYSKKLSISIVIRNVGTQIKPYYENHNEPLPFTLLAGISKKLEHAPFRFSFTATNLHKWDLKYKEQTNTDNIFDTETKKENAIVNFTNQILNHAIFGVEIIPAKQFSINLAYNHLRRSQLKLNNKPGLVGFSWGLQLNLKKISICYGRATYHLAATSNHLSLQIFTNNLIKRK